MTERCPTCGQTLPDRTLIRTAEQLVTAMRAPPPADSSRFRRGATRDVYEGYRDGKIPDGRFYLTYGKGEEVARSAVDEAVRRGLIVPTWPNVPTGSWSLPAQAEENRRLYEAYEAKQEAKRNAWRRTAVDAPP